MGLEDQLHFWELIRCDNRIVAQQPQQPPRQLSEFRGEQEFSVRYQSQAHLP